MKQIFKKVENIQKRAVGENKTSCDISIQNLTELQSIHSK